MCTKLRALLKDRSGNLYIEFLVGFFGMMMCLAFALSVLPVFSVKNKLDYAADRLMRQAEVSGHTNLSVLADELRDETGLDFTLTWNGTDYIAGTSKVQLNHDIRLNLETTESIGIGTLATYPVVITARLTGTSEVYCK